MSRHEFRRPDLIALDERRQACARVLRDAVPGALKRHRIPGALALSQLSAARSGDRSNPIFRTVVILEAMRQAGAPRDRAELIVEHLAGVIDELWPADSIDFEAAVRAEAELDATEDVAQTNALLDPSELAEWADVTERYIATARVAVRAARFEARHERRAAA